MNAPVVLISNINHSVYAARALADEGLLHRYLGPVMTGTTHPLVPRRFRESRTFPAAEGLPMRRLIAPELAQRFLSRLPVTRGQRLQMARRVLDADVALRVGGPQIVHLHTTGLVRTVRRAKARGAVIVTDHRALHPGATTYVDPLRRALEEEFELADVIIVNSELSRRSMLQQGIRADKLAVVTLGADTDFFAAEARPATATVARNLLFVGAVNHNKGLDLLVEALRRSPNPYRLRVAGREQDPEISRLLRSLPSVTMLGTLTRQQLRTEYGKADLLVLPSRSDSFPLVSVEALACGTPVVVSDRCGTSELVREHGCGAVVAARDATSLQAALDVFGVDAGAYGAALAGCAAASAQASWANYGQDLVALYRDRILPMVSS